MDEVIEIIEQRLEQLRQEYERNPAPWLAHRLVEAEYLWYVLKHRPEKA